MHNGKWNFYRKILSTGIYMQYGTVLFDPAGDLR